VLPRFADAELPASMKKPTLVQQKLEDDRCRNWHAEETELALQARA